uniref:Uncharacterized protein n=1 Tax=Mycena chlorophos TaxID=658473 RepID=A0ABQ0KZ20_MYCCL|nr:predicted protein [Mycena chlorophos]
MFTSSMFFAPLDGECILGTTSLAPDAELPVGTTYAFRNTRTSTHARIGLAGKVVGASYGVETQRVVLRDLNDATLRPDFFRMVDFLGDIERNNTSADETQGHRWLRRAWSKGPLNIIIQLTSRTLLETHTWHEGGDWFPGDTRLSHGPVVQQGVVLFCVAHLLRIKNNASGRVDWLLKAAFACRLDEPAKYAIPISVSASMTLLMQSNIVPGEPVPQNQDLPIKIIEDK